MNAEVFEQEIQKNTTYGACNGPSCSWRSVGGIIVQLLKEDGEVWPIVGLRSAWRTVVARRSVLLVRHEVQRSDPSIHILRVEVFWNEYPRRTVVPMTVRHTCRLGEWREQQKKLHKYGMTESMTVRVTTTVHREVRHPRRVLANFQQ